MRMAVAGVGFLPPFVCLSVFRVILAYISKTDAASITKLIETFYDESSKAIYFGVKRSKIKVTSHYDIAGMGLYTLVSAGFF